MLSKMKFIFYATLLPIGSQAEVLYNNVKSEIQHFDNLSDVEKFTVILLHFEKTLIRYLHNSWNIRQNIISK